MDDLSISEDLSAMLRRLAEQVRIVPDSKGTCPALEGDYRCDGIMHFVPGRAIPCRLRYYREERKRLAAQLALCGVGPDVDEDSTDVSRALLRALDQGRGIDGLKPALAFVRRYLDSWPAVGHVAMIGSMGLAKTHILLALFFAALRRGVSASWLTMADLRQLAKGRESHKEATQEAAELWLLTLQGRQLLAIDDLADRVTDQRSRGEAGSTATAAILLDLLNGTKARLCWSSNLGPDQLAEHPDVGPRVASRLVADFNGHASTTIKLVGADQRQHQMRLERRAS